MAEQAESNLEFRVLGPLEVSDAGRPLTISAAKHRMLLAALLLRAGQPVRAVDLVDQLWGDDPPLGARDTLRAYVMRLRKALGHPGVIQTTADGYRLVGGTVDLHRFQELVAEAKRAEPSEPVDAVRLLGSALALWRGTPLSDLPPGSPLDNDVTGLEEQRVQAAMLRIRLRLDLGHHEDVVTELRTLVDEHPFREPLWAQLMLALYRGSRQAEALDAYQRITRQLSTELGISPGAELRDLHQRILRNDPALAVPKRPIQPIRPPVSQLPPVVGNFVGRTTEIARLKTLLVSNRPVPIVTISGAPGVGKTSLAIRVGHEVRDEFPDGQLFVNLRGYAQVPPVRPTDVLSRFLRSLGVSPEQIPHDEEEQAARFRSELAGKRVLVVLDNANSPDQVRPLLPGESGCAVVVTSRDTLRGLTAAQGAHAVGLDVLGPEDSLEMLNASLGDEFVATSPVAAAELTQLCGHLPLALRIAVGNLTGQPVNSLSEYVAEMRGAERLNLLQIADDDDSAVRNAFDISYNALTPDTRRLFRLLSQIPGPDFSAPVSAALSGTTVTDAARTLSILTAVNLVQVHATGRYHFHDLIRAYATERAAQDETSEDRDAAIRRLLDHYLHSIDVAALKLDRDYDRLPCPPPPPDALTMEFADELGANEWLTTELPNIVSAVRLATETGVYWHSWQLANAIHYYFSGQGHTPDWIPVIHWGLTAAKAADDLPGQAEMHRELGLAYISQAQHTIDSTRLIRDALTNIDEAARIFKECGFRYEEANAVSNSGIGHVLMGQSRLAIARFTEAVTLGRKYGEIKAEVTARGNLGAVLLDTGNLRAAEEQQNKVLAFYAEGGRTGRVIALYNLGRTHFWMGRISDAVADYEEALRLSSAVKYKRLIPQLESELAVALASQGRPDQKLWETLPQYADNFDVALQLGSSHLIAGNLRLAVEFLERANTALRINGIPLVLSLALSRLAEAQWRLGSLDEAQRTATEALARSRQTDARLFEGRTLMVLAHIELDRGHAEQAIVLSRSAIHLHRETGHRPGEAETLHILGSAHLVLGDQEAAEALMNEAVALYDDMGIPQADDLRTLLAGLSPRGR